MRSVIDEIVRQIKEDDSPEFQDEVPEDCLPEQDQEYPNENSKAPCVSYC